MNKQQLMQTMFALCTAALLTTGCSNDLSVTDDGRGGNETDASVSFSLGLPGGDEVDYTRADANPPMQDASEWTVKTLKVYHFSSVEATPTDAQYTLVAAYNVPVKETLASGESGMGLCVKSADAKYQLKLSLRSKVNDSEKHVFAFIANDSCAVFDQKVDSANTTALKAAITLEQLKKCVADKKVTGNTADATLFTGKPEGLCMTGEKKLDKLTNGVNTISDVSFARIMTRMDVKNFVPESRNFKLLSVRVKYAAPLGAPQGYLFAGQETNIWTITEAMTITQNPVYTKSGYAATYGTAPADLKDTWVGSATADGRTGVWYKKVIYMYEYPKTLNSNPTAAPKAEVTYTLNGSTSTAVVDMKDAATGNSFDIKRNHVYTLQIGETSTIGSPVEFIFTDAPWTTHEIDADLNGGK